jgi:uncharacterized repeat protein (TIGR01451 family)
MIMLRRLALVLSLVLVPSFAQAQVDMSVTATDSPDPVAPDGNITYSVTVTNSGATTNAHLSAFLNNTLLVQSITAPAGWDCGSPPVGSGAPINCTAAVLAAPGSASFTIVLKAPVSQIGNHDATLTQNFNVNSALPDPNGSNDSINVQTTYDAPNPELGITATDAPDPVAPDGNITYDVTVTNSGQATTHANLGVPLNNTLLFQSAIAPAGWSCATPPVNGGTSINCSAATLAAGSSSHFVIVLKAAQSQFGINNTTIFQNFNVGSDWLEADTSNYSVTLSTAYVAPHADMALAVTDSPDPVAPDGNITYVATVANHGPDAATNARFSVPLNNTLLFQSVTTPAGWSCAAPPVNSGSGFDCGTASFAASASVQFTVVLKAAASQFGLNNRTIQQAFVASSDAADPDNANNSQTVSTNYQTLHADLGVTATDAPDPVTPNGNITYTVTATNHGPDAAPNGRLSVPMNGSLRFQSLAVPPGFSCTGLPPVGGFASFTCANPSFANAASAVFTLVLKADPTFLGNHDQTLTQTFVVGSDVADSDSTNDSVAVLTAYDVPDADLAITAADTPDPAVPGDNITFSGTIANGGPDAGANAVVQIALDSRLRFVSFAPPAGFSCTTPAVGATGSIHCTNPSFANGGSGAYTLVAQVDPALLSGPSGSIAQTFTIGSDAHDANLPNNSAQTATAFLSPSVADVTITKSTAATTIAPGGTIAYTLTAHNNGPNAATGVAVTDALPASLLFQSLSAAAGFSCSTPAVGTTGTIRCTAATLANGATATFTLVTSVASNAAGSIVNNATISANETDGTPANNGGAAGAVAVGPLSGGGADVPTLSEWALLALAALLAGIALLRK